MAGNDSGNQTNAADSAAVALARMKSQLEAANEIALLRARHEQALAEARQATATAKQAALTAELPTGTATAPAGTFESDEQANFIAELAAYRAVEQAVAAACREMQHAAGDQITKLLIVDSLDIVADDIQRLDTRAQLADLTEQARALAGQLDEAAASAAGWQESGDGEEPADAPADGAKGGLEAFDPDLLGAVDVAAKVATTAAAPALAIAGSTLSALADVAGFFKADVTIKGRSFDINKGSVTAAFAGGMAAHNCHIAGAQLLIESTVIDQYGTLLKVARRLQLRAGVVKQTLQIPIETAISAAGDANAERVGRLQQLLLPLQQTVAAAELHLKEIDEFTTQATAAGDDGSVLARVALRQAIHDAGFTHLLVADLAASGGETIIKKWLWGSPSRTFVGGATVSYTLLSTGGQIVAAGLKTRTVSRRHPQRTWIQRLWHRLLGNDEPTELMK